MPAVQENIFGTLEQLLVWQIADSAFPSGGFVHSGGLEANVQYRQVQSETLPEWIEVQVTAAARGILPFVVAAFDDSQGFRRVDHAVHVFINNPVVSRASIARDRRSWPP